MLKYHNWQQKKNNQRQPYLLSLGEEMVTPHIRGADSGNVDRHNRRAMRAMGVTCKQPSSPTYVKKGGGRRRGRCSICPTEKNKLEMLSVLRMGGQGPLYQDNSYNM